MLNALSISGQCRIVLMFSTLLLVGELSNITAQQKEQSLSEPSSVAVVPNQNEEEQDEEERRAMRRSYRNQRARSITVSRRAPSQQGKKRPGGPSNSSDKSRQQSVAAPRDSFVGFTLWQMKESAEGSERRKLTKRKGSREVVLKPSRIRTDTSLSQGEAYVFSIESTKDGYLYIVDQEEYRDGSLGEPILIFPDNDPDTKNNEMTAGRIVEIPKQSGGDYFQAERSGENHVGEVLTIIVTTEPLIERPKIESGSYRSELTGLLKSLREKWGENLNAKWTESSDEIGKVYTEQEAKAGADANLRLTEQDPLPQRLYRIKANESAPLMISLRLRYDTGN